MLTAETRDAVRQAAIATLARKDFSYFLGLCTIQSDDPHRPADIPFTPFAYQQERATAWQAHASEVILKPRQMGFSWQLAAYMLWRALLFGWNVGYYSRGEDETRTQISQRVIYIWDRLPAWLKGKPYQRRDTYVQFPAAGSIRAFPSTETAGIGYTFQLVVADECAFHRYGAQNYAAYRPTLAAGGQFIACSTADPQLGPSGFFYDLWSAATEGRNGYAPVFVPWYARPGRDEAWLENERARFTGMAEEFDAYYPDNPEAAFKGRSGLVFPQFSPQRHVRDAPCLWEDTISRFAGYDLGGGDPTAIVVCGTYRDSGGTLRVHQFGEAYWERGAPTVEQIHNYLSQWHDRAPFIHVERDPVGATSIVAESLAALGLPCPRERITNRVADRLSIHAYFLDNDLLTVSPDCVHTIHEYSGFRWASRIDPNDHARYQTSTPSDHHGDAMAALGQMLVAIYRLAFDSGKPSPLRIIW